MDDGTNFQKPRINEGCKRRPFAPQFALDGWRRNFSFDPFRRRLIETGSRSSNTRRVSDRFPLEDRWVIAHPASAFRLAPRSQLRQPLARLD